MTFEPTESNVLYMKTQFNLIMRNEAGTNHFRATECFVATRQIMTQFKAGL